MTKMAPTDPPCVAHNCREAVRCAKERLACPVFLTWVNSGRVFAPGTAPDPRSRRRIAVPIEPTRAIYLQAYRP